MMSIEIAGIGKNASFYIDDRIFLGEGLFETIRIHQQRPCYSHLHWQRMTKSATLLGISFELSFDKWNHQLMRCIQESEIKEGGVKVVLGGGRAPRGLDAQGKMSSLAFDPFTSSLNPQQIRLLSAPWRRDANNPIYQFKSINYLESIIARRQAKAVGADEALFFNLEGYATETTVANIFIIKQGKLFTPQLSDGLLAGIIRQRLIALSKEEKISCYESSIDYNTLVETDAVFTTNALQGIKVVKSIDEHVLKTNHPLIPRLQSLLAADKLCW